MAHRVLGPCVRRNDSRRPRTSDDLRRGPESRSSLCWYDLRPEALEHAVRDVASPSRSQPPSQPHTTCCGAGVCACYEGTFGNTRGCQNCDLRSPDCLILRKRHSAEITDFELRIRLARGPLERYLTSLSPTPRSPGRNPVRAMRSDGRCPAHETRPAPRRQSKTRRWPHSPPSGRATASWRS